MCVWKVFWYQGGKPSNKLPLPLEPPRDLIQVPSSFPPFSNLAWPRGIKEFFFSRQLLFVSSELAFDTKLLITFY